MKEQDLVIDMYYSLKSILKEESEYSIMCFDAEIRNLLRSIRDTDEMLEDELVLLGVSKGYVEKPQEATNVEIEQFKENLIK